MDLEARPGGALTARPPPLATQTYPWTAVGARMTTLAPATTPSPTTRRISGRQLASELGRGGADDHMVWDSERRWARAMARGRSIFGCDYILRCDLKHKSPSRYISANSSAITASASHPEPDPRLPPLPPLSGVRRRTPASTRSRRRRARAAGRRGPLGLALEPRVVECRRVVMVSVFYSILGLRTILVVNVIPINHSPNVHCPLRL